MPKVWLFTIKFECFQFEINVSVFFKDIARSVYTSTLETYWFKVAKQFGMTRNYFIKNDYVIKKSE